MVTNEKENIIAAAPITNITLFVTQMCNLNCVYCYGDGGTYGQRAIMTLETSFKSIDWLISQSGNEVSLNVSFFGGEPLLNFPLIKSTVEYAIKTAENFGKTILFSITTNALSLDEEKIFFLQKHKFKVVVSFDGPKEIHDAQRPKVSGQGSYDDILPKLRKLLQSIPNAVCRATIMHDLDRDRMQKEISKIGFKKISITKVSQSFFKGKSLQINNDNKLIMDNLSYDADKLLNCIKRHDSKCIKELEGNTPIFFTLLQMLNNEKRYFPCGAGRLAVGISASGDIFLCHRFVGNYEYKIGNINSMKLDRDKYLISPIEKIEQCKNCEAKYFCGGGCYYDNAVISGSYDIPDENTCVLTKHTVKLAKYISDSLTQEDIDFLIAKGMIREKICVLDLF